MTGSALPMLTALADARESLSGLLNRGVLLALLGRLAVALLILLAARILIRLAEAFGERLLRQSRERALHLDERRAKTLSTLVASITRYAVYFFAAVMILEHLGFNTTSILTAAGIGGLAIGFGAQNLVRDVITGFFILFEDQYGVGDYVTAGGVSGIVEEMGIRITKIRDFGGQLHVVPNGQITQVTNHMGPSMRVLFDVSVSYDANLRQAIAVLEALFAEYAKGNERLVEGPSVLGVQELGETGIKISVLARTKPMEQWGVERELKRLIKERFDLQGIEIPFPHRMVLMHASEPAGPTCPAGPTTAPAGPEGEDEA